MCAAAHVAAGRGDEQPGDAGAAALEQGQGEHRPVTTSHIHASLPQGAVRVLHARHDLLHLHHLLTRRLALQVT